MERIVGLASDHAGFALKQHVINYLEAHHIKYIDYGCYNEESCDYPDYAHKLAEELAKNNCTCGVGICGTGEGISMTLNKHSNVRAALCWTPEIAHMTRLHNDANVLVMPGRYINEQTATKILDEFFNTHCEGGRHINRIKKIPIQ